MWLDATRQNGSRDDAASGRALLVVDVQRDFLPGGALGVPGARAVVPALDRYISKFEQKGELIVFSRDWHPPDHCSFATRHGPWPVHCVRHTAGASFAKGLRVPDSAVVVSKGTRRDRDAYSAFAGTRLAALLEAHGVHELWVGGLATDYCVKQSVLGARRLGYHVVLLLDAVRGVDRTPGDSDRAIDEMLAAGAQGHSLRRPARRTPSRA